MVLSKSGTVKGHVQHFVLGVENCLRLFWVVSDRSALKIVCVPSELSVDLFTTHRICVDQVMLLGVRRHLEEGCGDKVFSRSAAGELTYSQLAERQNRCGNVLFGLGLEPGDRVLMVVMDCFEFFYLFTGAIKTGIVPVPLNTMWKAKDYQFTFEDPGCKAVVYSQAFAAEVEAALDAMGRSDMGLVVEGEGRSLTTLLAEAPVELETAPRQRRERCFLALFLGQHRQPQGHRAPPPDHDRAGPALCRRHAGHDRG